MDKIYKIIIILELILLVIFFIGYFVYEEVTKPEEINFCGGKYIMPNLSEIALVDINGERINILSDKKEDLNS